MSKSGQMFGLLGLLILIWGLSWPVMAIGLAYCPPIWFSTLRLIGAAALIFIIMGLTRQLVIPDKKDFPLIFSIGFLQIGLFVMLITLGLEYVPPGRSAIIAYTSPIFVTPVAVWFFSERLTKMKIIGLLLGLMGIVSLFMPWELNWHDKHILLGNALLLLSAIIWSAAMLHIRYGKWHRPSHQLLPWQFLVSIIPNIIMAFYLDPHPVIHYMAPGFWWSMGFTAVLASLAGFWMIIVITRFLPAITISLLLLAVPVVGLLSSAVMTGEKLSFSIIVSFIFIIGGLVFVSLPNSRQSKTGAAGSAPT
jgi:drug/metabolite transporter (DMT)-like permease